MKLNPTIASLHGVKRRTFHMPEELRNLRDISGKFYLPTYRYHSFRHMKSLAYTFGVIAVQPIYK